ncbi:MAG: adventurous gliding motility protein CglE [Myxococcaceae bacterium]|nr:adventurous gliding motility protein CglE [Myxococcaceae bacterium]
MMRPLFLACCLVPYVALAQGATLKDKEELKFNEIERGFTIGMAAGWAPIFNLPGNAINADAMGANIGCKRGGLSLANEAVRLDIGADIGSRGDDKRTAVPLLVVTAMLQAAHAKAGTDYFGTSSQEAPAPAPRTGNQCVSTDPTGRAAAGDFAMLGAGLAAKVNIIGFADSQDVKRLWLYARVAGGVNFYFPNTLISQIDPMLQAGGGIEYYTRLRHFSIGLEANFQMMFVTTTFGVTLTPTLRYSF